jgi:ketosteroid isomerase-like protein
MNDEALALADRFFKAIEAADIDALSEMYADSTVIWHNTDQVEQPSADNLRLLGWVTRHISGMRYEDVRRQPTPGGFVQQHVLRGTNREGHPVEVPAVIIAAVADGHITRIDEYIDSAHTVAIR